MSPKRVAFDEFKTAVRKDLGITDEGIAREFYEDYRGSNLSVSRYVEREVGAARTRRYGGSPRRTKANGIVKVPTGKSVYLGRTVKDIPPKGFSHVKEVSDTAVRIARDVGAGAIDRRTANARLMRLKGIVEQTKTGELVSVDKKLEAVREINTVRMAMGFRPASTNLGPVRPTAEQIKAARRNILKAQEAVREKYAKERALPVRKMKVV